MKTNTNLFRRLLLALIVLICLFNSSDAQTENSQKLVRKGFIFGTSVGASHLKLDYAEQAPQKEISASFPNFKIGVMLSNKTALLLYLPGSIYTCKDSGRTRDRGFEGIVPSVQYWVSNRVWVLGGAGLGMDAPAFYDIKSEDERKFYFGATFLAGAGYEILQTKRCALDLQGRFQFGNANMPDGKRNGYAVSFLIGFNWY